MKKHKITKRFFALAICLCMIFTMMPMAAHATTHEHDASCGYAPASECTHVHGDDCGYYNDDSGEPCDHDCNVSASVCGYVADIRVDCDKNCPVGESGRIEHVEDCSYSFTMGTPCGHVHSDGSCSWTPPSDATCSHTHDENCGYSEGSPCTYVEPEHSCEWGDWISNGNGTHTRTCTTDASHTETADCSAYSYAMVDEQNHNILCECMYVLGAEAHTMSDWFLDGEVERRECMACFDYFEERSIETHTHSYSTATCTTPATCSDPTCGETTGDVDKSNHVGGTEIRDAKDATETEDGYTGDTYCKGCGDKLSDGETIPATGGGDDDDDTHTHSWKIRQRNETYHEEYCSECGETGMQGMHTYGDDGICTACGHAEHNHTWEYRIVNESRHEPYCPGCGETGLQGMHTWKYVPAGLNSHSGVCTVCQYESSEKILHENNEGNDCWCDICGAGIHNWIYKRGYNDTHHWHYECDVCGEKDEFGEHALDPFHFCGGCAVYFHSFSNATCTTPATCSCGETTSHLDPSNHTGGTEIRNAKEATRTEKGYTGDTYCLGCGSMIESGEEIPTKGYVAVKIDDDADVLEVTFTTVEGVTLPDDVEVIVEDHTATLAPVESIIGSDVEIEYITVADNDMLVSEPPVVLDGVTYYNGEIIVINGEEFLVVDVGSLGLTVMRLSDSVEFIFDGEKLKNSEQLGLKAEKRENQKLNINGVTYDVVAVRDGFSSLDISILYYKGKPAGQYRSETGVAVFNEGYDPATLKAQRDDIYLGRVTADNTSVVDLTPGKTYNVSVIGSNDIHLEGAENVGGTVTQTFEVPAEFVGNMYVKYVAYHGLVEGYELGKTFLSEDGKTLTATYAVDSFSPFIIYAFVEADEPEIKTLSATIVDGSDDTTEAPDTSEPVESPQTSDSWIWYILIAVVAGAIVVVSVVYGKRRKSKAN